MREDLRRKLDRIRNRLVAEVGISVTFMAGLVARNVINSEHKAVIEAEKTDFAKIDRLLDILKRRNDVCYDLFREVLVAENSDLAQLL